MEKHTVQRIESSRGRARVAVLERRSDALWAAFVLATMALLLALAVMLSTAASAQGYKIPSGPEAPPTDENLQLLQRISKGVSTVSQKASEAVVFVSVYKTVKGMPFGMIDPFDFFYGPGSPFGQPPGGGNRRGGPQQPERREGGLGSGFFIDMDKGYILTNNHVIQDADEIQLKLANEETYEGKIVGRDRNTDVAVVQIKDPKFNRARLSALSFADSDKVAVGDFALALGAPFGLEASISFGVISAVSRGTLDITKLGNFIQTDAAINPGNSGGPLINMAGQVIGMNTAIYSRSGAYNGIGFAVPSNFARRVAEQLINEGRVIRGYMGVALQPIDPELHKSLGLAKDTTGSLVARVVKGGPADKAGLEPGDVITAVAGKKVRSDSEVVNAIGLMKPGTATDMTVMREGKTRTVRVTVERWPNEDQVAAGDNGGDDQAPDSRDGREGPFGLSVSKITPMLKERWRFETDHGLVVVAVGQDSAAARAGLQPGDLILQAAGKKVTDLDSLSRAVKGAGSRVLLRIERGGNFFFVPVRTQ
jgi:serine protease Do